MELNFAQASFIAFKGSTGLCTSAGGNLNMSIGSKQEERQYEAKPSCCY